MERAPLQAKRCPHCGQRNPHARSEVTLVKGLAVGLAVLSFAGMETCSRPYELPTDTAFESPTQNLHQLD